MSSDDSSDTTSSSNDERQQDTTTSSEAAGIIRGLGQSIKGMIRLPGVGSLPRQHSILRKFRSMIRFPGVGRLPHQHAIFSKRRLPVQRVASVSDRLSTGMDLVQTALEQERAEMAAATPKLPHFLKRGITLVKTLIKNTLLGAAVFETYEYMVTYLASPGKQYCDPQLSINNKDDNDNGDSDVYERASLQSHFLAGACGGFVHAIPSTFWEKTPPPLSCSGSSSSGGVLGWTFSSRAAAVWYYWLPTMIVHHSIAHSILFGCYECLKREFVMLWDHQQQQQQLLRRDEIPYFVSVAMAGGLAGQIQHVVSHYTEQWLWVERTTTTPSSSYRQLLIQRFVTASSPTLRPTLLAFPPSAISFVAFE